jgi:hypothetical protein
VSLYHFVWDDAQPRHKTLVLVAAFPNEENHLFHLRDHSLPGYKAYPNGIRNAREGNLPSQAR